MTLDDSAHDREVAMYAHEMRGALTIIAGYTEMLRRDLTPEERERAAAGVERAVTRADQLISDMLDGRASVTECDTSAAADLAALVREVVEEHEVASARRIAVAAPESVVVRGDGAALGRVIDNLLSNALKYSLDRSEVDVTLGETSGSAVLEIADRGPGISEADLAAVFEPYVRLERDRGVSGTGLGLSVVKRIVEAHGGTISLNERSGGGTVARVELPLAPTACV